MKFLKVAKFIVNNAIRATILLLVFMTLIGQDNPEFFTVASALISWSAAFVLLGGLRLILRRLNLWPYVVACLIVAVVTFVALPVAISYQLMLVFCLITAGIPAPHDFEWAFYGLPVVFYFINFASGLPVNQIFSLVLLWLLFLMQSLLKYEADVSDIFEKNTGNPTFNEGKLVQISKSQFLTQFFTFMVLGLIVIGVAIWQRPFTSYDELRFNSAQVEEPQETKSSSVTVDSTLASSTATSTEQTKHVYKDNKWLDSLGSFMGTLARLSLLLLGILLVAALIVFIFVRAIQQIREKKVVKEQEFASGDAVILSDSTPFKKYEGNDSSTNKRLRLRYKKVVEHEFTPKKSSTPAEQLAQMPYAEQTRAYLQQKYEKARYSGATMTKEELREFTAQLKAKIKDQEK